MTKVKLKTDVRSNGKNRILYGEAGDIVTVTNERDNMLIVKNNKGIVFPVNKDKIEQL